MYTFFSSLIMSCIFLLAPSCSHDSKSIVRKNNLKINIQNNLVTNEEAFSSIYKLGEWGKNKKGEGISGAGSTIESARAYMNFLQEFIAEKEITSVVDLGCGDWEFSQHIDWSKVQYTGIDVVKNVIERNMQRFSKDGITFIHADGAQIELPKADLFICKDVLQHLRHEDIFALCAQLQNFKYCLITNDIKNEFAIVEMNGELSQPGGHRTLDLTAPPFNLKATKVFSYSVPDSGSESIKEVLLIESN